MGGWVGGETEGYGDVKQGLQESTGDAADLSASICLCQRVGRWKGWVGGVGKEVLFPCGRCGGKCGRGQDVANWCWLVQSAILFFQLLLDLLLQSST